MYKRQFGGRNAGQFQVYFSIVKVDPGDPDGDRPTPLEDLPRTFANQSLLGLIETGVVKSAHDCAEGGLAVAAAECAVSELTARQTPRLTGAEIDLSDVKSERVDALLYGEAHGRVIITTSEAEAGAAIERAILIGVPAQRIGTVTAGETLDIGVGDTSLSWKLSDLHDVWWNTIARAMDK